MALTTSTVTTKLLNLSVWTSRWTRALQGRPTQLQGATIGTTWERIAGTRKEYVTCVSRGRVLDQLDGM